MTFNLAGIWKLIVEWYLLTKCLTVFINDSMFSSHLHSWTADCFLKQPENAGHDLASHFATIKCSLLIKLLETSCESFMDHMGSIRINIFHQSGFNHEYFAPFSTQRHILLTLGNLMILLLLMFTAFILIKKKKCKLLCCLWSKFALCLKTKGRKKWNQSHSYPPPPPQTPLHLPSFLITKLWGREFLVMVEK